MARGRVTPGGVICSHCPGAGRASQVPTIGGVPPDPPDPPVPLVVVVVVLVLVLVLLEPPEPPVCTVPPPPVASVEPPVPGVLGAVVEFPQLHVMAHAQVIVMSA
jgi:hypothetical protein